MATMMRKFLKNKSLALSGKSVRIGITVSVLTLAFGGLLWTTLSEGTEYYKHVDEVMADPVVWQDKNLQVHGFVVPDSIQRKRHSLEYRFEIENNGSVVRASYAGIVPDTFKDGAEVVVRGRLGPEGIQVIPNGVMAKCPSKYEPKPVAAEMSQYAGESQ